MSNFHPTMKKTNLRNDKQLNHESLFFDEDETKKNIFEKFSYLFSASLNIVEKDPSTFFLYDNLWVYLALLERWMWNEIEIAGDKFEGPGHF